MTYKLVETSEGNFSITKDNMSIPRSAGNRHYRQFIEDIALGNDTVEGPDVIEPSYAELRQNAYPSIADQLDMQYWDSVNGTTTWADAIQAVKDAHPTTVTGATTVGDVPSWVQEEADAWLLTKQTNDYAEAVRRLAQYRLADGREEVTEEITENTNEYQIDDDGIPVTDDDGKLVFVTNTYTVVTVKAVDPLPATVTYTTIDEDGNPVENEIPNPAIVKDDEERAAAQAVIDATPQPVIDAYNAL